MRSISKKLIALGLLEFIIVMFLLIILFVREMFIEGLILGWLGFSLFATMIMMVNFYEKLETVKKKDWLIVFLLSLFLIPLGLIPYVIGVWLYWRRRLKQEGK